jgi:hypothetical protein
MGLWKRLTSPGARVRVAACVSLALLLALEPMGIAFASSGLTVSDLTDTYSCLSTSSDSSSGSSSGSVSETVTLDSLDLSYENPDDAQHPIACNKTHVPSITTWDGTLQLYAQSEFDDGSVEYVDISGVAVVWTITAYYDEDGNATSTQIASIDRSTGEVSATGQGNGSVTVRCTATAYQDSTGANIYAETELKIEGNSDQPYVTSVQICDSSGSVISDDGTVSISSSDFGITQKFYAQVTYYDPSTKKTTVKNTYYGDTIGNICWSVSCDSGTAYVNDETGAFIAYQAATVTLTCSVKNSGLLGDTISDKLSVLLGQDTLDNTTSYDPADYLKVVVEYESEEDAGTDVSSQAGRVFYYTLDELASLGTETLCYTLIKGSNTWYTMKAYGVDFESLIGDLKYADTGASVVLSEIKAFRFAAADNYMSSSEFSVGHLFNSDQVADGLDRYYYPHLDIGTGSLDAQKVKTMIALETVEEKEVSEPSGELSSQTRFRLCLGASSTTDNNAQSSVYNINTITIVLSGSPAAESSETTFSPTVGQTTKPTGTDDPGTPGNGNNTGNDPDQGGGGDTPGSGNDPSSDDGDVGATSQGDEDTSGGTSGAVVSAISDADGEASGTGLADDDGATTVVEETKEATARTWEIAQMMKKEESEVSTIVTDSPYTPYFIVGLVCFFLLGGLLAYRRYRTELIIPGTMRALYHRRRHRLSPATG